jgi:hypothetical protein
MIKIESKPIMSDRRALKFETLFWVNDCYQGSVI